MTALPADPSYHLQDSQAARIVVSPSDLRQLFNQVEVEFCQSKVYQKVMSWFQHQLKDNDELVSQLANALGREAIRLTLRQLIAGAAQVEREPLSPHPAADGERDRPTSAEAETEALHSGPSPEDSNPFSPLKSQMARPLGEAGAENVPQPTSERHVASSSALQTGSTQDKGGRKGATVGASTTEIRVKPRNTTPLSIKPADIKPADIKPTDTKPADIKPAGTKPVAMAQNGPTISQPQSASTLSEAGSLLKQARQQRGLTLDQLYQLTHVPKHHIQAIENGVRDRLPEEVYVRGFVRHLCNALELDSKRFIPYYAHTAEAPVKTPLQRQSPQLSRHYLRPAHLYTGYATLMLGALGGLCWITWQPIADEIDWPEQAPIDAAAVESDLATFRDAATSKLRYFEVSKQRSRHLAELDSIAAPELILEQLQGISLSEAP